MRSPFLSMLRVLLAFLVLRESAHAGSYRDTVLASRPLAYWPLDEATGSIRDVSGHGHDGIAVGGPGYRRQSLLPGRQGFAVDLSPGNRFLVPGFKKFTSSSTGYTIAYWIRLAAPGGTYTQVVGDGVAGEQFYLMNYLHFDERLVCLRPHYGANQGRWDPDSCTIGANLTAGQAHHVVTAWDRAAGTAKIYIDGLPFVLTGKPTGWPGFTDLPMWIGHDNREGGWNITLDEVALWDRPLTEAEVKAQLAAASAAAVGNRPTVPALPNAPSGPGSQADESGLPDFLRGGFEWFDNGVLHGTVDFFRNGRAKLSWSDLPHTWNIDDTGNILIKAPGNSFFVRLTFDRASRTFHGARERSAPAESTTRIVLIPADPAHPTPAMTGQETADTAGPIPAGPASLAPTSSEQKTLDTSETTREPEKIPLMSEVVCYKLSNKFDKIWEGGRCWLTLKTDETQSTWIPQGANLRRTFQGRLCWAPSAPLQNPSLPCLGNDETLLLSLVNTFSVGSATFLKAGPGNSYYAEFAKLKEFIEAHPSGTFSLAAQGGAPNDNLALAQARAHGALVQLRSELRARFPALALKADRVLKPVVDGSDGNDVRVEVRMEILDKLATVQ